MMTKSPPPAGNPSSVPSAPRCVEHGGTEMCCDPGPAAKATVASSAKECELDPLCRSLAGHIAVDYATHDVIVVDPQAAGIRTTTRAPTSTGIEWRGLSAFAVQCHAPSEPVFTLRAGADLGGGTSGYRDQHAKLAGKPVACHCVP
jgi:hypothetical protein